MSDDIEQLFSHMIEIDRSISEDDLIGLPEPVQRNLIYCHVVGEKWVNSVHLKQKGYFKLKPGQKWMSMNGTQYFSTNPPGFLWKARVKVAPLIWISGRDMYKLGSGSMKMKLWSFIRMVNAIGPKLDQGAMVRYMAEIVWFPTAYLSNYLTWETMDINSARATMSYGNITASATLHYDNDGRLVRFVADRYMGAGATATLEKWSVTTKDYKEISGIMIPAIGEVTWHLPEGDFTWAKIKVTDIEYNIPLKYL